MRLGEQEKLGMDGHGVAEDAGEDGVSVDGVITMGNMVSIEGNGVRMKYNCWFTKGG